MSDKKFSQFFAQNKILWQFNLSYAPCSARQFERVIVLVKDAFNKVIGCGLLMWQELEDVVLNMETTLNDWPLSYVEDDVALPILTPDSMMF